MKKLLNIANRYVAESDWKTIAALKFCLLSLGVLAGMRIPKQGRRPVRLIAAAVFTATYFPLMAKLFRVADAMEEAEQAETKNVETKNAESKNAETEKAEAEKAGREKAGREKSEAEKAGREKAGREKSEAEGEPEGGV